MNQNIKSVPFASPSLNHEEEEAVLKVLRSGWLTTGHEAQSFEQEFSQFTGAPYSIAVNSATAGLHLAVEALGVGQNDVVITSTYTFTASAEVIRYCGGEPSLVDIDPETLNMDIKELKKTYYKLKKEGKTVKGIIPVHIGGNPTGLKDIYHFAQEEGLFTLEDAAHCFPVKDEEKGFIGTWTDAGVYSFYANKTITTGEGGMIVTSSKHLADRMKVMRLHGIDRSIWNRFTDSKASWKYDVVAPGFKYNLTDIAAAIGRIQLKKAEEFKLKRELIVKCYNEAFQALPFVNTPQWQDDHAWHLYIIQLNLDQLTISRDDFIVELQNRGIGCSVHYRPLHKMSYYKERYNFQDKDFPNASRVYSCCLSLPLYPDMREEQYQRVIDAVKEIGSLYRRTTIG